MRFAEYGSLNKQAHRRTPEGVWLLIVHASREGYDDFNFL
jgi:hypothetical protein